MVACSMEHTKGQSLRTRQAATEIALDLMKLDQKGAFRARLRELAFAMPELHNIQLRCQTKLLDDLNDRNTLKFEQRHNPLHFTDSKHWLFAKVKEATGFGASWDSTSETSHINTPDMPVRLWSGNKCINPAINEIFDRVKNDAKFKEQVEAITERAIPRRFDKSMQWFIFLLGRFELKLSPISQLFLLSCAKLNAFIAILVINLLWYFHVNFAALKSS